LDDEVWVSIDNVKRFKAEIQTMSWTTGYIGFYDRWDETNFEVTKCGVAYGMNNKDSKNWGAKQNEILNSNGALLDQW